MNDDRQKDEHKMNPGAFARFGCSHAKPNIRRGLMLRSHSTRRANGTRLQTELWSRVLAVSPRQLVDEFKNGPAAG